MLFGRRRALDLGKCICRQEEAWARIGYAGSERVVCRGARARGVSTSAQRVGCARGARFRERSADFRAGARCERIASAQHAEWRAWGGYERIALAADYPARVRLRR